MNSILIFLIILILFLVIWLVYQHTRVIITNRSFYDQDRQIAKEREATAAILGLSGKAITSEDLSDETFLTHFVEYAQRTLRGIGASVLTATENDLFSGCAVSGTFPPLKEVPPQVEQQLLAHPKKHTEFIKEIKIPISISQLEELCKDTKYVLFSKEIPKGFPENIKKLASRILIAPIYVHSKIFACTIVVSRDEFDEHMLCDKDGEYLVRLNEIASLSLEAIGLFRERRQYEEKLRTAKEEGMLQVSTGIIHNIGNAVTVAKLTVLELQEKNPDDSEAPESFILNEIIPKFKNAVETGTADRFLKEDSEGRQYLGIISELLTHVEKTRQDTVKLLGSLSNKLYHISEIIELQQRFMGELGTENMTSIAPVIESSIKIFEETCNKKGVSIRTSLDHRTPQVLVDPSMMTQVFINLIKNAVEAMESEGMETKKEHYLELILKEERISNKNMVAIEVKDNGPGIPDELRKMMFTFGFSTKQKSKVSRGYGLHSCMDTVKKYGGEIAIESKVGEGTTFKITLPVGERR
ncbi:MAG: ATP-binding protein [Victivallales bacterium]|jgi:signal transduction histidine kinase